MDNAIALVVLVFLLLRGLPLLLTIIPTSSARRLRIKLARYQALLDVGVGTLMAGFVGALVWYQAWVPAVILAAISLPAWASVWSGLRTLARTADR